MSLALELRGITKVFPGVRANDGVDLTLRHGEIHAVLGENGAGKSTLMKIISGLYAPDAGQIFLNGEPVRFPDPRAAIQAGIGMVHQHFMLIPVFTVAENVVLGAEPRRGLQFDRRLALARVRAISQQFGLEVDPSARVETLSVGQQQRVEILKTLYRQAKVLILDEPTAMLTPQETRELFRVMRGLATQGVSILFISHKLDEVLEIAERITVMRHGQTVGTVAASATSRQDLANRMVGREVVLRVERAPVRAGAAVAKVDGLCVEGKPGLKDVSFDLRAGEIFGIAGVEGNGQQELLEALAGLRGVQRGKLTLHGRDLNGMSIRERLAAGLGYVPPDRQTEGLILTMSVTENLALRSFHRPPQSRGGLLQLPAWRERAQRLVQAFDVRPAQPEALAKGLSGGNQQKVVLAREIGLDPEVLIVAQPTRGLDVGAIEFVHRRLLQLRDAGKAILLVSLELDEILALADRIGVLYGGRLVTVVDGDQASKDTLGLWMTGGLGKGGVA